MRVLDKTKCLPIVPVLFCQSQTSPQAGPQSDSHADPEEANLKRTSMFHINQSTHPLENRCASLM